MLTAESVAGATGANAAYVAANWPYIVAALEWAGIDSPAVRVGMAATVAMETGDFMPRREKRSTDPTSLTYRYQQKYWPSGYYGRGYIQLTGKGNYAAAGEALGIDLLGDPDQAYDPATAAKVAAWFFKSNGVDRACEAGDWQAVRRLVNGPDYHRDKAALARFMRFCLTLWVVA